MYLQYSYARVQFSFGCPQAIGAVVVGAMTYLRIRDQTDEQVFDRSYRLRYNKGQNHLDIVTYGMAGESLA